jgi:hypothetical protein
MEASCVYQHFNIISWIAGRLKVSTAAGAPIGTGSLRADASPRAVTSATAQSSILMLSSPIRPTRQRSHPPCGDHLHPHDAGYKAMADAIDLKLFQ